MKKLLSFLLCIFLVVGSGLVGYAVGDGNIDSGGNDMNQGSSSNFWNLGMDGVRITVVRASDHAVVTTPIDFTNKTISSGVLHFGKVSKKEYNNGTTLSLDTSAYTCYSPGIAIPTIVTSSGVNNIDVIKSYFCSEYAIQLVADLTGMDYDTLINGNYKLLLEPIAYYTFQGVFIATTATEAALYDQAVDGLLRAWMKSLSHQNLPLAMFLEVSDLGYPAWTGSTSTTATNADIISSLGLGVVRFTDEPEIVPEQTYDYTYRVDTEVITAVYISGGQSDPDTPTTVRFTIDGTSYAVSNVYYPSGDGQLAWVKWQTPSNPQEMTISVSVSGPGSASQSTIQCEIVDLDQNPPPNPVADDRNDSYQVPTLPSLPEMTSAQWTVWTPWWQEFWVDNGSWHTSSGVDSQGNAYSDSYWVSKWEDEGWWMFDLNTYSASLTATMNITCDGMNPTAVGDFMKSGYGINQEVSGRVSSTQSTAVTQPQTAVSYFPEFYYETYWRLLEETGNSTFEFQKNQYSTYQNRTHFTPIWMPDGSYTVATWLLDAWTPVGMLSANLSDSLTIQGDLWDDWHIAPLN